MIFKVLIAITAILAPIIIVFVFINHIKKISKSIYIIISKNYKKQMDLFKLIIEWFNYIDINLDQSNFNLAKLSVMEKEIDHQFSMKNKNQYILKFNKKFRKKVMKRYGYKKEFQTDDNFLKYSRLNQENIDLILKLSSEISNKKYNTFKFSFHDYWNIIRGNFYNFYSQYSNSDKKQKGKLFTIADIEEPIRILRFYFNI